ncbi:MAG: response regulator [Opitutaceae bacterium]|nr:response regulator [Opitutaceae bacterium]
MLVVALRQTGHAVMETAGGKAGLKHVRSGETDLVITDLVMPDTDGIEVIMALRKQNPKMAIIAISGFSRHSPIYLTAAKHLGARRILEKPFEIGVLHQMVDEVLLAPPSATAEV